MDRGSIEQCTRSAKRAREVSGFLDVKGIRVPFVVLENEGNLEDIVDESKLADLLGSLCGRPENAQLFIRQSVVGRGPAISAGPPIF